MFLKIKCEVSQLYVVLTGIMFDYVIEEHGGETS